MENTTTTNAGGSSLVSHAARMGVILAAVSIVLTLLLYIADYTLMVSLWMFPVLIVLTLGIVIYAGINYRNTIGGYIPYGKAFQHAFLVMVIAGFIVTLFNLLLYTVIDPDLPQNLTDAAISNTEGMMRSMGAPEDAIDKQMDQMRTDMPAQFSAAGSLKQFGWNLIVYAIVAAITSLFVRKNEPEMM